MIIVVELDGCANPFQAGFFWKSLLSSQPGRYREPSTKFNERFLQQTVRRKQNYILF